MDEAEDEDADADGRPGDGMVPLANSFFFSLFFFGGVWAWDSKGVRAKTERASKGATDDRRDRGMLSSKGCRRRDAPWRPAAPWLPAPRHVSAQGSSPCRATRQHRLKIKNKKRFFRSCCWPQIMRGRAATHTLPSTKHTHTHTHSYTCTTPTPLLVGPLSFSFSPSVSFPFSFSVSLPLFCLC